MRLATTAMIASAAVLLAPAAALATPPKTKATGQSSTSTTTRTVSTTSATTTAPASVPTTTITTTTPGVSATTLPLAPPRPPNLASGRLALTAYASYLQTLVNSESAGEANDAAYVSTVESGDGSGCKSSLEPLTQGTYAVRPAAQNTLKALGKEIGDDLAISYDDVAVAPLDRLATALDRLKWVHGGRNGDVINNYLTAETALLAMPQSDLCGDALLAASKPLVTPAATRAFLAQYDVNAKAASAALGGFLLLLHAYATSAERALVERIAALAGAFAADSKTSLLASGQQLTVSLQTS